MLAKKDKNLPKFGRQENDRSRAVSAIVESSKLEARDLIRFLYPRAKYGNDGGAMRAAFNDMTKKYEVLKSVWTHRRVRSLWDGNPGRVDSFELDALRAEKAILDEAKTKNELENAASFLEQIDPERYGHTADNIRYVAYEIGLRREEEDIAAEG